MHKYTDLKGESVTWFTKFSFEINLKINLLLGIAGPPENFYRQPENLPVRLTQVSMKAQRRSQRWKRLRRPMKSPERMKRLSQRKPLRRKH